MAGLREIDNKVEQMSLDCVTVGQLAREFRSRDDWIDRLGRKLEMRDEEVALLRRQVTALQEQVAVSSRQHGQAAHCSTFSCLVCSFVLVAASLLPV